MESRKTVLCRAFLDLLYDQDFSVTSSAFQQLGAFITTFAQPSLTALGSNQNGETILIYNEGSTFKLVYRAYISVVSTQPGCLLSNHLRSDSSLVQFSECLQP